MLFDRLRVEARVPGASNAILIIGGAGGGGSVATVACLHRPDRDRNGVDDPAPHSAWRSIGTAIWDALLSDKVAVSAGFEGQGPTGRYDASDKLMTAIGYSALDSGSWAGDAGSTFVHFLTMRMNSVRLLPLARFQKLLTMPYLAWRKPSFSSLG